MNLVLIANCQVQPYAAKFSALSDIEKVVVVPIHLQGRPMFESAKVEMMKLVESDADLRILTFNLDDSRGEISTSFLKERCEHVKTFTNIFFDGLQPDCTYLADIGKRVPSPIGDYHSKIVVHSFVKGLSVSTCIDLFNLETYRRVGYLDRYGESMTELRRRDEKLDIPLADSLDSCFRKTHSLFTFNHPTSAVFSVTTSALASAIGLNYPNAFSALEQNHLANSSWFPIFPEILDFHNCTYTGNYVFKPPTQAGGKFLSLEKFVTQSYELYASNRSTLLQAKQLSKILEMPVTE
jgi:hypothetical protein